MQVSELENILEELNVLTSSLEAPWDGELRAVLEALVEVPSKTLENKMQIDQLIDRIEKAKINIANELTEIRKSRNAVTVYQTIIEHS